MTTLERILDAIEIISSEMDYIYEAVKGVDNSVPEKARSIADIVEARELTNRRCVDFYESLLESLDWDDFDEDYDDFEEDED